MPAGIRQRLQGTDLKQAVEKEGVDAINSDEEANGVLDELQQEQFIQQMELLVTEYIGRWRAMFAWLSLLVVYIEILNLVGLMPVFRPLTASFEFRSVILNFAISPLFLSQTFFHIWPLALGVSLMDICAILWVVSACMRRRQMMGLPRFSQICRTLGLGSLLMHLLLTYAGNAPLFGRHFVLTVTCPLLCLTAETLVGSGEAAVEGLDKLSKFKYSHKKA